MVGRGSLAGMRHAAHPLQRLQPLQWGMEPLALQASRWPRGATAIRINPQTSSTRKVQVTRSVPFLSDDGSHWATATRQCDATKQTSHEDAAVQESRAALEVGGRVGSSRFEDLGPTPTAGFRLKRNKRSELSQSLFDNEFEVQTVVSMPGLPSNVARPARPFELTIRSNGTELARVSRGAILLGRTDLRSLPMWSDSHIPPATVTAQRPVGRRRKGTHDWFRSQTRLTGAVIGARNGSHKLSGEESKVYRK